MNENVEYKNTRASLYNTEKIDFKHEPLFFGSGKNTQRFDDPKIPFFDKSNDTQQGFDWKHDEIPLIKDAAQFKTILKNAEKFVVTRNFQKLIFLDSLQGRGPFLIFGQITTLPELENAILTWTYFEGAKHSRTYTEELRALYDHPDEIFDEAFTLPELQKLAKSISAPYERAYFNAINWIYKTQRGLIISEEEKTELYQSVIMAWVEVNALEGIRFYPGFASVWGLMEGQGYLPGTAENLQFICRDENEHLAITQFVLKLLKRDVSEGFSEYFKDLIPKIKARYIEIYYEEVEWIVYKFSQGSYIGMNDTILIQYLNYITIRRMKAIGLTVTKEDLGGLYVLKNPIPWVDKYINMDEVEKLPQEEKVLNYVTGGVDQDVADDEITENISKLL